MRGRRIAFDFGTARIGIAVCDPDGILVTPLEAISIKGYMKEIKNLIAEYQPIMIYVGNPVHLSGSRSSSTDMAQDFAAELEALEIPVKLIDERLTTISAAKALHDAGYSAKESKKKIDSASAVAILELGLSMERE